MKTFKIIFRQKTLVITDPQRRVYNGQPFSSEIQWTGWGVLETGIAKPRNRLKFWRSLNDYAVSQRGKGAKREFKIEEEVCN